MNFGPINTRGGEKRLNVIFSRARRHMAIVSTIGPGAVTNTYNDGANTLRGFLGYAAAVSQGDTGTAKRVLDEPDALPAQGERAGGSRGSPARRRPPRKRVRGRSRRRHLPLPMPAGRPAAGRERVPPRRLRRHEEPLRRERRPRAGRAQAGPSPLLRLAERVRPRARLAAGAGGGPFAPGGAPGRGRAGRRPGSGPGRRAGARHGAGSGAEAGTGAGRGRARRGGPRVGTGSRRSARRHFVLAHAGIRRGGSSKFWEIGVRGRENVVRFGRIGTAGQEHSVGHPTEEIARAEARKLVESKIRKGYVETAPRG